MVASAEAEAQTEMAAAEVVVAEIEVTAVVIAVVVIPWAAGDEDAYGSADELRSLPRNSLSLRKLDMCMIPVHAFVDAPGEVLEM